MSAVRILLPCAQYETLLKDDWEMHNDNERDYARMPFELRVVEAALDVVRPFWCQYAGVVGVRPPSHMLLQ